MPANQQEADKGQNWAPQVFNIRRPEDGPAKVQGSVSESQANKVRQAGGVLLVTKKQTTNQNNAGPGARAKALDDDHDTMAVKTLSHDIKVELNRQRLLKGWTQAQLAAACSERASVITDYESGKILNPSEKVICKMEKALGVYLRGTLCGQPMPGGADKAGAAAAAAAAPKK